ncbi:MAG: cation:proton antiporter [Shinella sp.]|nr:cation:proton antiporter [Shinella sp.]
MTMAGWIIEAACGFALALMSAAFLVTVWRVIRGPTLPDRIVGLDMLVAIAIGFIAVIAISTGYTLYVDIAISLGLVGFLATVAFARFVLARGMPEDESDPMAPPRRLWATRRKAAGRRRKGA